MDESSSFEVGFAGLLHAVVGRITNPKKADNMALRELLSIIILGFAHTRPARMTPTREMSIDHNKAAKPDCQDTTTLRTKAVSVTYLQ